MLASKNDFASTKEIEWSEQVLDKWEKDWQKMLNKMASWCPTKPTRSHDQQNTDVPSDQESEYPDDIEEFLIRYPFLDPSTCKVVYKTREQVVMENSYRKQFLGFDSY